MSYQVLCLALQSGVLLGVFLGVFHVLSSAMPCLTVWCLTRSVSCIIKCHALPYSLVPY